MPIQLWIIFCSFEISIYLSACIECDQAIVEWILFLFIVTHGVVYFVVGLPLVRTGRIQTKNEISGPTSNINSWLNEIDVTYWRFIAIFVYSCVTGLEVELNWARFWATDSNNDAPSLSLVIYTEMVNELTASSFLIQSTLESWSVCVTQSWPDRLIVELQLPGSIAIKSSTWITSENSTSAWRRKCTMPARRSMASLSSTHQKTLNWEVRSNYIHSYVYSFSCSVFLFP